MPEVFDGDGNVIADVPLSRNQLAMLMRDVEITVTFHTPQTLRYVLGERHGTFSLRRLSPPDARIVTRQVQAVRDYAAMLRAIARTRENA